MLAPVVGVTGKKVGEYLSRRKAAKIGGVPSEAVDALRVALRKDTSGGSKPVETSAGADIVTAGPHTRGTLNVALKRVRDHSEGAEKYIDDQVSDAFTGMRQTMDDVLGSPQGLRTTTQALKDETGEAIGKTYDAAYRANIDYSTKAGTKLHSLFTNRMNSPSFRKAVNEANDMMALEAPPPAIISFSRWTTPGRMLLGSRDCQTCAKSTS